jgi:hypothetical protein
MTRNRSTDELIIEDDLPDLDDLVLDEEVVLLAPYFKDKILEVMGRTDGNEGRDLYEG